MTGRHVLEAPGAVGSATRMESLTGMRFVAAGAIIAVHSGFITGYDGLGRLGIGVSFFFVLSGFVLTWSWRDVGALSFYRNRFARIYPVYVVAWAFGLWTEHLLGVHTSTITLVTTLTLTQTWINDSSVYFGANGAAWSLSCEAFFYAAFPFLVRGLVRATPTQRRLVLAASVAFTMFMSARHGSGDAAGFLYWVTFICPLGRIAEFIAGMVLALEVRAGLRCPPSVALVVLGLLAVTLTQVSPSSSNNALSLVPFLFFITAGATIDLRGGWSPFRTRVAVALGAASYCLYLVHVPVYSIARATHDGVWTAPGKVVGVIAVGLSALLLAELLHRLVERPFEALLRAPRRRPSAAAAQADLGS